LGTFTERHHGCLCIAKALRPDHATDTAATNRLLAEGRPMQRLAHPHLVRGYETHTDPAPIMIMEILTGQTPSHLVTSRRRPLPTPDLLELGRQLCSVLGYLHRKPLLHLDLKPSNVVASGGLARLIDLSHARAPGACPAGFGTAEYMSPEQLRGGEVGTASDVYGLGGVLFRTATRKRPFTPGEREADPDRPVRLAPLRRRRSLSHALVEVISGCLEVHPGRRPSLAEAADAFETLFYRVRPPLPQDRSSPLPDHRHGDPA
jgi:serine/threonine protein kinase